MPRPPRWSRTDVLAIARTQLGLVTAAQLRDLGVPRSTVARSDDVGGMFTWVLPGIHRTDGRGPLSADQRDLAAQLFGGGDSLLTGATGLRRLGVRAASSNFWAGDVASHVLVPHFRHRSSHGFAFVERTVAFPSRSRMVAEVLRIALPARATLDAARRCTDEQSVRALIFEVVQRRLAAPEQLHDERVLGQIRGSRYARRAIDEVMAGPRSIPEGDLRRAFEDADVCGLLYNPVLVDPDGSFLASPDVYDPRTGTCLEVDSREFHFEVGSWESTMARHARMTMRGLAVLHSPPSRIRRAAGAVVAEFVATQQSRTGVSLVSVRVLPRAA